MQDTSEVFPWLRLRETPSALLSSQDWVHSLLSFLDHSNGIIDFYYLLNCIFLLIRDSVFSAFLASLVPSRHSVYILNWSNGWTETPISCSFLPVMFAAHQSLLRNAGSSFPILFSSPCKMECTDHLSSLNIRYPKSVFPKNVSMEEHKNTSLIIGTSEGKKKKD